MLSRVSPRRFEAFASWMKEIAELTKAAVVAIDGKTLRRSHDRKRGKSAIHMVSAFATANGLVLGQAKVDAKSGEAAAVPELPH